MKFEFRVRFQGDDEWTSKWMQVMGGGGPVGNGCLHAVKGKSAAQMKELCSKLMYRVRVDVARTGEIREWVEDAPVSERIVVHDMVKHVLEARYVP